MRIGKIFSAIDVSASGLSLQRKKMDAIASNLANIDSVGPDGKPYQRQDVASSPGKPIPFSQELNNQFIPLKTEEPNHMDASAGDFTSPDYTVREVAGKAIQDPKAVDRIYDPSNPEADTNGYVSKPKINVVTEMVDMIATTRSYEANVTAINASKSIIKDSLDI